MTTRNPTPEERDDRVRRTMLRGWIVERGWGGSDERVALSQLADIIQAAEHKALERAATIAESWHNTGLDENVRAADRACEEVARAIRAEIGDGDAS